MPIIRECAIRVNVRYNKEWDYEGLKGCGYSFPCDSDGTVNLNDLFIEARKCYWMCIIEGAEYLEGLSKSFRLMPLGIVRVTWEYEEPAIMKCSICETEFPMLMDDMASCGCPECGKEYDSAGRPFTDRPYWGEETGESLILIMTKTAHTDKHENR